jgi:ribosomal protein L16/L10AE
VAAAIRRRPFGAPREAFRLAGHKLPIQTKFLSREG